MSTLKKHTSQELDDDDTTLIQCKKQKLDKIPVDNNTPIENSLPNTFSKLEKPLEALDNHDFQEGRKDFNNLIQDKNEEGQNVFDDCTIQEQVKEKVLDILNPGYTDPEFIRRFCFAFKKNQTFTDETSQAVVYNSPFSAALLPNIFDNEFLSNVKDEVKKLDFDHKSNDLYEFHQSLDLRICAKPYLSRLRDAIYSDIFVRTMSDLVGIDLDYTPDLSAHKYEKGNYLLCHDDDIKDDDFMHGRRIAFIIYLVDQDWSKEDGGALELFNT